MIDSITPYGFIMGPLEVRRLFRVDKHGAWIEVRGRRESVEIRVTPSGLIRVFEVKKRKEAK